MRRCKTRFLGTHRKSFLAFQRKNIRGKQRHTVQKLHRLSWQGAERQFHVYILPADSRGSVHGSKRDRSIAVNPEPHVLSTTWTRHCVLAGSPNMNFRIVLPLYTVLGILCTKCSSSDPNLCPAGSAVWQVSHCSPAESSAWQHR